jgi:hypothetical protein
MIEIRPAETDDELERFLAVVARVTPEDRLTVAEVRVIEGQVEMVHLLAVENGEAVGAAGASRNPYAPNRTAAFANVTFRVSIVDGASAPSYTGRSPTGHAPGSSTRSRATFATTTPTVSSGRRAAGSSRRRASCALSST